MKSLYTYMVGQYRLNIYFFLNNTIFGRFHLLLVANNSGSKNSDS